MSNHAKLQSFSDKCGFFMDFQYDLFGCSYS